jgi:hypothetical protein
MINLQSRLVSSYRLKYLKKSMRGALPPIPILLHGVVFKHKKTLALLLLHSTKGMLE